MRTPDQPVHLLIRRPDGPEVRLTPAEAGQLVEGLQRLLSQVGARHARMSGRRRNLPAGARRATGWG